MEKKNLQQLNQYRDELLESLSDTDYNIIVAERDERNSKLNLYQAELIGKCFKIRKFDTRMYKILEIIEIGDNYIDCSVIRVTPDGIIETIIAHVDNSIEITESEFKYTMLKH